MRRERLDNLAFLRICNIIAASVSFKSVTRVDSDRTYLLTSCIYVYYAGIKIKQSLYKDHGVFTDTVQGASHLDLNTIRRHNKNWNVC